MVFRLNLGRSSLSALVGTVVLAIACGSGVDGTSGSPSTTGGPGPDAGTPDEVQGEAPGPWAPSRALNLDRFALETALQSALQEPAGAELSDATVWTLSGEAIELRFEVRTWFSTAEAEMQCRSAAGSGSVESLALGAPVWTASDAVYIVQDSACVQVTVARSGQTDVAGATAVAAALLDSE
jgi:hypothetical protein